MNIREATDSDLTDVLFVEKTAFGYDKEAKLVKELRRGVIGKVAGKVRCADMLNKPEHWRE